MALAASWSRTSPDLGVRGVLQLLVHGEEVLHLVEDVPGQLGDVLVIVVGGVVKGDGDDFLILLPPSSMMMTPMG